MADSNTTKSFGTAPVFFTAISTILGAILFLRFGYSVGTLGFIGTLGIIFLGNMVTIPTALAISELATNQRVEGGGEYFIISRSFGLNIGATIGIALYLSQAISVAFYIIAFTEAFSPLLDKLPIDEAWARRIVSIPSMLILAYIMLKRGANMGVKTLYIVVALLAASLVLFFLGKTDYSQVFESNLLSIRAGNINSSFFIVFAIIFPAFTGMTAGVGLSGDLKNPSKSIPLGTTLATVLGMIIYCFIAYKLAVSASPDDLINDQLIMSKIAVFGPVIIPIGLAASTISSAIGSIMVAPRTLQALAIDDSLPLRGLNKIMARGKGSTNEPFNATFFTSLIAFVFVFIGGVDFVAQIISMFFMVTYGSICLISFLYHFGADPSYRPVFKSRWYLSLIGFLCCTWLMFKMQPYYAMMAFVVMIILYLIVSFFHKDRGGMAAIFQGAIFQLSRNIQVYMQKKKKDSGSERWRPSVVCISRRTFENDKALQLLGWISDKYGFGTYIHLIDDYFSSATNRESLKILERLIEISGYDHNAYMDTLISPSYTSAIAQTVQLPGVSGMANNMILFEFDKDENKGIQEIIENVALAKAAKLDVCVLASSQRKIIFKQGIHVWIRSIDFENSNLMILLSYIILGHPDWKKGKIKIFEITKDEEVEKVKEKLTDLLQSGRLPISPKNIEIIEMGEHDNHKHIISERSKDAGLTVIGFREEALKHDKNVFSEYDELGDILFVNASQLREIN
ncbi:MAG: amino acid permease [Bacteroidales bacterium]|nr:amino acid permease [Bacteroidales bacterium]